MQHQAMILFENGEAGLRGIVCRSGGRLNEAGLTLLSCYFQHWLVEILVDDVGDVRELAETPLFCIPTGEKARHFQDMNDLFAFIEEHDEIDDFYLYTNDSWFHATSETLNWEPLIDATDGAHETLYHYEIETVERNTNDVPKLTWDFLGHQYHHAQDALQRAATLRCGAVLRLAGAYYTMEQDSADGIAKAGFEGERLTFVLANDLPTIIREPLNTPGHEVTVVAR